MKRENTIAIIGSGSWATAIAKVLHKKEIPISWYFRNQKNIDFILTHKHNPNYLTGVTFDTDKIVFSNILDDTIEKADILILAVPSIYLKDTLSLINIDICSKKIVSAIKGVIPVENTIVGTYLHYTYDFPLSNFCVISGPSHAEEVAMERLSYLTIAGVNSDIVQHIAKLFRCKYIQTSITDDIYGTEYAAILKNIMAIAVGICHGLRYGDNFQAVLVSNAIQEIDRFINKVYPIKRDIKSSAYLGDLLVTTYSQFSRNRTFGTMIGKGYSAKAANLELNMIVEGYYALKWVKKIINRHDVYTPITNAVYNIIHKKAIPAEEIQHLTKKLK